MFAQPIYNIQKYVKVVLPRLSRMTMVKPLLHLTHHLCTVCYDIRAVPSGNKAFCLVAVKWAMKGSGILKMANVSHRIVDGEQGPHLYRVNDQVLFECDITEEKGGKTKPYKWVQKAVAQKCRKMQ